MQAIKSYIGSLPVPYEFDSNVVIEIPTSCQPVRVFPPDSKDSTVQSTWSEVALYTLVDISYGIFPDEVNDYRSTFYITVPSAIQDVVQACVGKLCSGIRYIPSGYDIVIFNLHHTNLPYSKKFFAGAKFRRFAIHAGLQKNFNGSKFCGSAQFSTS